jgi:hypothetical protein
MLKKILLIIVVLLILVFVGAQLYLQYGLTDSIRKYALPAVREKIQLEVAVGRVGVNLLTGSISIHDVRVANPEGFTEPEMAALKRFRLHIGIPALLRGGIAEINRVVVRDGAITVVRNADGALNIEPLLGMKKESEPTEAVPTEPTAPAPGEARQPLNILIKTLEINTRLNYLDYRQAEPPFKLGLELRAKLNNVANYGNAEVLSVAIDLQGNLLAENKKSAFEIYGRMAPIIDPRRLCFDVFGSMQEVDLKPFKELIRQWPVASGTLSGTATLRCKNGIFNTNESRLRLTVKNIKLAEGGEVQLPNELLPPTLDLEIPVKGTLEQPEIDGVAALIKALQNWQETRTKLNLGSLLHTGAHTGTVATAGSNSPPPRAPPPADPQPNWPEGTNSLQTSPGK